MTYSRSPRKLSGRELLVLLMPCLFLLVWGIFKFRSVSPGAVANRLGVPGAPARQVPKGITDVAFIANGKQIVTSGEDGSLKIWSTQNGTLIRALQGKGEWIQGLAVSPNGLFLATSAGAHVGLWNVRSGRIVRRFSGRFKNATAVALSANDLLAAGFGGSGRYRGQGEVRVWNLKSGRLVAVFNRNMIYTEALAFSPDAQLLVALASGYQKIKTKPHAVDITRVWKVKTQEQLWQWGQIGLQGLSFSRDGKKVAAGGSGSPVLFDISTGKASQLLDKGPNLIGPPAFSPDGTVVACAGVGSPICFWDVTTRRTTGISGLPHYEIKALTYSGDGTMLASGGADGLLKLWRLGLSNPNSVQPSAYQASLFRLYLTVNHDKESVEPTSQ